ncbi:peptidogalycan biosysnthesis protein [Sorangium sp. So ce1128]
MEKFFFVSWQDELVRMNPESARWSRWVIQAVNAYRAFARAARAGIDGWVLAASPLSYRGGIAMAPVDPAAVQEVHRAVLDALKNEARRERLPLCFYGVDAGRAELRRSLRGSGFEEVFLVYDNRLDTEFKTFDDYFARFQSKERRSFKRDMRKVGEAGIKFTVMPNFGSLGGDFERLYETTYSKYGEEHFRHPESFWAQLERHLGPRTEAIVARNGSTVVGFASILHKGDDLWVYPHGPHRGSNAGRHAAVFQPRLLRADQARCGARRQADMAQRRHVEDEATPRRGGSPPVQLHVVPSLVVTSGPHALPVPVLEDKSCRDDQGRRRAEPGDGIPGGPRRPVNHARCRSNQAPCHG